MNGFPEDHRLADATCDDAWDQIAKWHEEREDLAEEIPEAIAELEDLESKRTNANEQYRELRNAPPPEPGTPPACTAELAELGYPDVDDAQIRVDTIGLLIAGLEAEIDTLDAEIDALRAEREYLATAMATFAPMLDHLAGDIASLDGEIASKLAERASKESEWVALGIEEATLLDLIDCAREEPEAEEEEAQDEDEGAPEEFSTPEEALAAAERYDRQIHELLRENADLRRYQWLRDNIFYLAKEALKYCGAAPDNLFTGGRAEEAEGAEVDDSQGDDGDAVEP